jgi:hypothetical protein
MRYPYIGRSVEFAPTADSRLSNQTIPNPIFQISPNDGDRWFVRTTPNTSNNGDTERPYIYTFEMPETEQLPVDMLYLVMNATGTEEAPPEIGGTIAIVRVRFEHRDHPGAFYEREFPLTASQLHDWRFQGKPFDSPLRSNGTVVFRMGDVNYRAVQGKNTQLLAFGFDIERPDPVVAVSIEDRSLLRKEPSSKPDIEIVRLVLVEEVQPKPLPTSTPALTATDNTTPVCDDKLQDFDRDIQSADLPLSEVLDDRNNLSTDCEDPEEFDGTGTPFVAFRRPRISYPHQTTDAPTSTPQPYTKEYQHVPSLIRLDFSQPMTATRVHMLLSAHNLCLLQRGRIERELVARVSVVFTNSYRLKDVELVAGSTLFQSVPNPGNEQQGTNQCNNDITTRTPNTGNDEVAISGPLQTRTGELFAESPTAEFDLFQYSITIPEPFQDWSIEAIEILDESTVGREATQGRDMRPQLERSPWRDPFVILYAVTLEHAPSQPQTTMP